MLALPVRFVTDFFLSFFFLAINSTFLWDPNYRFVLNFVLFLHQLGWSQHFFRFDTGSRPKIRLPECASQACEQLSHSTWHLDLEAAR